MPAPTKATIVLAAGGSGGHMFPAQALAVELQSRGYDIVLISDERGLAFTDHFPSDDIRAIEAATFAGANPIKRGVAGVKIIGGLIQSIGTLRDLKPVAVVGFGGYPSFPTMVAATLLRIPTALHDPNAVLGRVNKFLAGYVNLIGAAFDNMQGAAAKHRSKVHVVGNPIRENVRAARNIEYHAPGESDAIHLLVFGGSQGAQSLSQTVPDAIGHLPEAMKARLHVVQQARTEDMAGVQRAYDDMGVRAQVATFFANLPERMAEAHLVIARAGASTVTELGVIGRPSILVPLPTAMDDHQTVNAAALTGPGGAWLMPQAALTAESLGDKLLSLLCDQTALANAAKAARSTGRPDAGREFADLIEGLIESDGPDKG